MKILSITAQKPHSTGSGVYLTELVNAFDRLGHSQAVIAGVCEEDTVQFPDGVSFFPVYYQSASLPFPVAGMSDEMPYESTRYRDMTPERTEQFCRAFSAAVKSAVMSFQPDLIICHHLYLLTALVRELLPSQKTGARGLPSRPAKLCQTFPGSAAPLRHFTGIIAGICHGSDLRQLKKNPLLREEIREQIRNLDIIFCLHQEQRAEILRTFSCRSCLTEVLGTGFNSQIFHKLPDRSGTSPAMDGDPSHPVRLLFAGKISEKKGVMSLLRALRLLPGSLCERTSLTLAGGHGNEEEYQKILSLASPELGCPCPVRFTGRLSQKELAELMNRSDIFVLPSFYEGLPLVLAESLACGMKTVCTDLPGIRPWMDENLPGHGTCFVAPPPMENEDEPVTAALPAFESALARAIEQAAALPCPPLSASGQLKECLSLLSWDGAARRLLETVSAQINGGDDIQNSVSMKEGANR